MRETNRAAVVASIALGIVALAVYALTHRRRPIDDAAACVAGGVYHLPDPRWTPGKLCSKNDPDYDGDRYGERIAHCRRNVTKATKIRVAERYGVRPSDLDHYEIDHLIELNAGGSNDESNLWPQPLGPDDAGAKDRVEDETFRGLRDGTMTQEEAVEKIRAWRPLACR